MPPAIFHAPPGASWVTTHCPHFVCLKTALHRKPRCSIPIIRYFAACHRSSAHGFNVLRRPPPGNAIENPPVRYNIHSAEPIMGATWFRRGLQSSVGHTEDQLPRKSNWKRNSRQRRQLRPSRLIPARLCTGFLVGRVRTARRGCRVIRTRSRYAGLLCASAKK
jgi:hypothetical protein